MNTHEIKSILHKFELFGGVFPLDMIPSYNCNKIIIVNFDPSNETGSHWVSLYYNNIRNEYFDSYGYKSLKKEITKSLGKCYKFNGEQLQSFNSDVCGHFCVFYTIHKCSNFSLESIINHFTENLKLNDEIVYSYVENISKQISYENDTNEQFCCNYANNIHMYV